VAAPSANAGAPKEPGEKAAAGAQGEATGPTSAPRTPGAANDQVLPGAPRAQADAASPPAAARDNALPANVEQAPPPADAGVKKTNDAATLSAGEPAAQPAAPASNERPGASPMLPGGSGPANPEAAQNGGLPASATPIVPVNAAPTPGGALSVATYAAPIPVAGLAVEIVARARDGQNSFEIRLDPPELGRIDVHLRVDRDGNVSSRLIVERSETLDLLRRDAPALERALQNAGLKTGEQGLEFSLRDQMPGREHNDRDAPSGSARVVIPDDEVQPSAVASNRYGRSIGLGAGIDIRV
jgi:chemotaxis protein MotD